MSPAGLDTDTRKVSPLFGLLRLTPRRASAESCPGTGPRRPGPEAKALTATRTPGRALPLAAALAAVCAGARAGENIDARDVRTEYEPVDSYRAALVGECVRYAHGQLRSRLGLTIPKRVTVGLLRNGALLDDFVDRVLLDATHARRSGSAGRFVPYLERTPRIDYLLKQAVVRVSAVVDVQPPFLLCASSAAPSRTSARS